MKFYKISIVFLFLLILSVGVVCAEDSNQTAQDSLEVDEGDVLGDGEGTYTQLEGNITQAIDTITLESNYKYNSIDGDKKSLKITNKNLTIYGNNKIMSLSRIIMKSCDFFL